MASYKFYPSVPPMINIFSGLDLLIEHEENAPIDGIFSIIISLH
jgi:hypothetical protein